MFADDACSFKNPKNENENEQNILLKKHKIKLEYGRTVERTLFVDLISNSAGESLFQVGRISL